MFYIGFGGHGNQVRDVIHIEDVCEIVFLQIKNIKQKFNDTFNVGGGVANAISLKELTLKCQKLTKNKINIYKKKSTSIYDIPYFITDNAKINKCYEWKPSRSVDIILHDIYKWLKNNKKMGRYFQ